MEQMISTILPDWIHATEIFGVDQEVMFDEEARLIAGSIPARRAEFFTGRKCAHVALSELGVPATPILRGPNREPLWPKGVVGSITHCGEYCAAAVALSGGERWIGIDAESNEALPKGIIDQIASPSEIEITANVMEQVPNWDRLLFSAKESIYKAWYPCRQARFDALDFSIKFSPESSCFDIGSYSWAFDSTGMASLGFSGRYLFSADLILTSVVVTTK